MVEDDLRKHFDYEGEEIMPDNKKTLEERVLDLERRVRELNRNEDFTSVCFVIFFCIFIVTVIVIWYKLPS